MQQSYDAPVVWMGAMSRLLASSWASLCLRPTLPAKVFWRRPTRKWPSGAETQKPYKAILNALASMCARARALVRREASFGVGWDGRPAACDPMTSWRKEKVATVVMSYTCRGRESKKGQPDVNALVRRGFLESWTRYWASKGCNGAFGETCTLIVWDRDEVPALGSELSQVLHRLEKVVTRFIDISDTAKANIESIYSLCIKRTV